MNIKIFSRNFSLITEHSKCQPGLPLPFGESQPGSSGVDGFQRTKSSGFFLNFETSTLAPATSSSGFFLDSLP